MKASVYMLVVQIFTMAAASQPGDTPAEESRQQETPVCLIIRNQQRRSVRKIRAKRAKARCSRPQVSDYFFSRCTVWRRREGLYFFTSRRPCWSFLFFVVK